MQDRLPWRGDVSPSFWRNVTCAKPLVQHQATPHAGPSRLVLARLVSVLLEHVAMGQAIRLLFVRDTPVHTPESQAPPGGRAILPFGARSNGFVEGPLELKP